jgi:DNA-binding transcriptional regulator YiaG
MNNDDNRAPKTKPQPWRCGECREKAVFLEPVDYSITLNYEGRDYALLVPALPVGTCRHCGYVTIPHRSAVKIDDALVKAAGILTAAEIRGNLLKLQLEPAEVADYLGVDAETVALWADGMRMQSRAQDRLMRLYFELPAVREYSATFLVKRESSSAHEAAVSA